MNWLEDAIAALAPRIALRRAHARLMLGELRAYDAAKLDRRTEGWRAGGGDANAEVGFGLGRLRNRARELVRNNEYAVAAVDGLATALVGTGITSAPADKAERRLWDQWWGSTACDMDGAGNGYSLQRLAARAWFESGECLVRRFWRGDRPGLAVPLQLRIYEADYLDESKTGPLPGGHFAVLGIEFDRWGQRVAYWMHAEHPGSPVSGFGRNLASERVDARDVLHLYDRTRPGQVRAVSRLATSLMRLRNLGDYEDALLMRKKIEACFGVLITTDSDSMKSGELTTLQDGRDLKGEKVYPGMIKYLRPGESVDSLNPTPTLDGEWSVRQLHAIAVGCGMTYAQLTGDQSKGNFSSNRIGLLNFRAMVDVLQWLVFVPQFVQPVREWFREAARDAGRRVGSAPDKITMPKRPQVDPLKDALAVKELARGGLMSRSELIRELGYDPEEVRAEIAEERAADAAAQLVFDTDAAVAELKLTPAQAVAATAPEADK